MYKVDDLVNVELKFTELLFYKQQCRVLSDSKLNNLTCFLTDDKENIEPLVEDCINSKIVHSEKGVDLSFEKFLWRSAHPRENEFYEEVSKEYLEQVETLKKELKRV